jgi:dCMP deaminase
MGPVWGPRSRVVGDDVEGSFHKGRSLHNGPRRIRRLQGWNGFPRGCDDSKDIYADKNRKLRRIVHAEANAIVSAKTSLAGCTIYVSPLHPCASCAGLIIQSGISRVVTNHVKCSPRWQEEFDEAALMFKEAGVTIDVLSVESGLSIR